MFCFIHLTIVSVKKYKIPRSPLNFNKKKWKLNKWAFGHINYYEQSSWFILHLKISQFAQKPGLCLGGGGGRAGLGMNPTIIDKHNGSSHENAQYDCVKGNKHYSYIYYMIRIITTYITLYTYWTTLLSSGTAFFVAGVSTDRYCNEL